MSKRKKPDQEPEIDPEKTVPDPQDQVENTAEPLTDDTDQTGHQGSSTTDAENEAADTAEASDETAETVESEIEAETAPTEDAAPSEDTAQDDVAAPDETAQDDAVTEEPVTDESALETVDGDQPTGEDVTQDVPDTVSDTETVTPDPVEADTDKSSGLMPAPVPRGDRRGEAEAKRAEDKETKPAPEKAPEKVVERVVEKRGSVVPLLIGGVLAAGIGFVAGRSEVVEPYLPESWRSGVSEEQLDALRADLQALSETVTNQEPVDLGPLEARLSELRGDLAPLQDTTADLRADLDDTADDVTPLSDRIAEVETLAQSVQGLVAQAQSDLTDFAERLVTVEKRPIAEGLGEEAIAAYEREFQSLQDQLAQQRSEIEAAVSGQVSTLQSAASEQAQAITKTISDAQDDLAQAVEAQKAEFDEIMAEVRAREERAEAEAKRATAASAMAAIRAALDAGDPYAANLDPLTDAGTDPGPGLTDEAGTGVATLSELQDTFPDAARDALVAAREDLEVETGDLQTFLIKTFNVRSTAPREGDDADAILSRADAALTNGELKTALIELQGLPDKAKAAMADWLDKAEARQAAVDAANEIDAQLNAN